MSHKQIVCKDNLNEIKLYKNFFIHNIKFKLLHIKRMKYDFLIIKFLKELGYKVQLNKLSDRKDPTTEYTD